MAKSVLIRKTPTIEATPDYSDGDVLGGIMTLENVVEFAGDSGIFNSACAHSAIDHTSLPIRVLLFDASPADSTTTENSAFVLHANDKSKLVGVLDLSSRASIGTPDVLFAANPAVPFTTKTKDLYAVAIAGGTMNFGSTSDLTFVFGVRRD